MWASHAEKPELSLALPRNPTAASTRRRSIAITRRSGRCSRRISRTRPAMCSKPAAAPASTWSNSHANRRRLTWWPSGLRSSHLQSIDAWRTHSGLPNIQPARFIDLSAPDWGFNADDFKPTEGSDRDLLRQCDPHRALAGGAKVCSPTPRAGCGQTENFSSTVRSSATACTPRRATKPSIRVLEVTRSGLGRARHRRRRAPRLSQWTVARQIVPMPANNMILIFGRTDRP